LVFVVTVSAGFTARGARTVFVLVAGDLVLALWVVVVLLVLFMTCERFPDRVSVYSPVHPEE
jgi:hypothetical protein